MDNSKNLELEILIIVRQNNRVSINDFYKVFEHRWNLYDAKFYQLFKEGLFVPVQLTEHCVYQLTPMGQARIAELIELREQGVSVLLLPVNQPGQKPYSAWKSVMDLLNGIVHFRTSSQKDVGSEPQIISKS